MKRRLKRFTAWMLMLMLCMGSITVSATESDNSEQAADTILPADDNVDDGGTNGGKTEDDKTNDNNQISSGENGDGQTDVSERQPTNDQSDGTDDQSDGTDDQSDGTDDQSDGTDDQSDGTDNQSDGTDNQSVDSEVTAEEESTGIQEEEEEYDATRSLRGSSGYPSDCGSSVSMTTGWLLFLTLAENPTYRWNANSPATRTNEIHLDDYGGSNCNFRLYHVEDEWYGIKHISSNTYNGYYVDVEDKSEEPGKVLHLWENSDDEVRDNNHRQFAFYDAGKDDNGNRMYYIRNRKSGLWVGVQDNKIEKHRKLVQTTADKAKKWYVTDCVVPDRKDVVTPWTDSSNSGLCYLNLPGTIDGINIANKTGQAEPDGMEHNFYKIGTSGRWALNYFKDYNAYEIESVGVQWNGYKQEKTNKVWDIPGAKGSLNGATHQWTKHSKSVNQNTNQLWRFIDAGDGYVKIQNARTGLFIGRNAEDVVSAGSWQGWMIQVDEKNALKLEIQLFSNEKSPNIFSHSTESTDWMKKIPDEAILSTVNIPGTHDTGTKYGYGDDHAFSESWTAMSCQNLFYEEQLQVGVRSFDIRCDATKTAKDKASASDVTIVHGSSKYYCTNRDGGKLTLKNILDTSISFLDEHEKETIILMIKPDDGSVDGLVYALSHYISGKDSNKGSNKEYFYSGGDIPSMKEARGKIVLLRRYDIDTKKYDPGSEITKKLGFDLSGWDDHDYGKQDKAICIYTNSENGCQVWAQDNYKAMSGEKKDSIYGTITQSTSGKIPGNAYIYNFTSGTQEILINMARDINYDMLNSNQIDDGRLGMIMWNYVDETTSRLIYKTNENSRKFMEPKVTFPKEITLTYGQTLSEAALSGQSGEGTFTFSDEDSAYMPVPEDVGKKEFTMTFIPNDDRLKSVSQKVKIAKMNPKDVNVLIDNKEIEYGQSQPELTITVLPGELVGDDTKDDLGISLAVDMRWAKKLTAGSYDIYAMLGEASDNVCYNVRIPGNGTLTVKKKPLGVTWSDTTTIVYETPDAATWEKVGANVTAGLEGVIKGDDCTAVVTDGNKKEPSWKGDADEKPEKYTAKITGLSGADKDNYELPAKGLQKDYYIRRKNADDFVFPTSATVIYGQPLSTAVLEGASGDGEFIFMEGDQNISDSVPGPVESNPYTYNILYKPHNSETEHGGLEEIPVTVLPKPVTVTVKNKEKTYGETVFYEYDEEALEEQMEGTDNISTLSIALTAGMGDAADAPAGSYPISGSAAGNPNYSAAIINGTLTVNRKPVDLTWTPGDDASYGMPVFTYDGNPANLSASVGNLLAGDTCNVTVVNGNRINAGDYTAVAVRLSGADAGNYRLTKETENLSKKYRIQKATPEITAWPAVSLTYGQTLAEASITGGESGSINGTFRFTEQDALRIPEVADSQATQYSMEFIPEDTVNYQTITGQVTVTVNRKPVQAEVGNVQKIYGDAFDSSVLTCQYDENDLVKGDTLKIELKVYAEDGSEVPDVTSANVGIYSIGDRNVKDKNPNYDVQITEGTLDVLPREVILKWDDTTDIVYNEPSAEEWEEFGANVKAEIANLVPGDDCTVKVDGGNEKEASYQTGSSEITLYKALAVSLLGTDSGNYIFADEDPKEPYDDYENSRIKPYVIRRNVDEYFLPKAVVITYGKNLGSITNQNMIGASGRGEFKFMKDGKELTEEEKAVVLDAGTYPDDYQVRFIPSNTNILPSKPQNISLIVIRPRITVTADNKEKTYGNASPEYTVQVSDPAQLVNGDKAEGLMTLKAISYEYEDGAGEDDEPKEISGDKANSPVGTYDIVMDEQKNKNYRIKLLKGRLTIGKREIEIAWSDTSNLIYNGKPAGVTAVVSNLVKGDTCNLTIVGGDAVNAGNYMAWVNDVDNPNYCIPSIREGNLKNRIIKYTIQKATPEVVFPKVIVLKKGDVLSGAKYEASANVPGTFTFEEADAVVYEDGDYVMSFTPDDTGNYNTVNGTVRVKIKRSDGGTGNGDNDDGTGSGDNNGGSGTNQSGKKTDTKKAVDTSDSANIGLFVILLIVSGTACGTIFVLKRKRYL